ncbi:hypothetical protein EYB26_006589 [Talaromyces marneffei]|uniref:uncharacterized protein n=1 Tax=Talaromyces marneffei TaxID=37727 RepID=UPI0012AA926C|nr:uncharacterized protein EYB26_006589 [Talaromyces marneffei]QGA18904.1 hypothetical protein EYB26_006589 [Talaromyces marneffei]
MEPEEMRTPISRSSHPTSQVQDIEMYEHSPTRSEEGVAPPHAVNITPRWNESKTTIWKVTATCWCMLVMGANDASYGAIIPYLELYYRKSYTVISLVFLAPFAGYIISAILSNLIHLQLGRKGVAIIGPGCHLLAFAIISIHPPFPVLVMMYLVIGFASGIQNAAWNVWVENMANPHEVLGVLPGFYGVGATCSPLIATTVITKAGWEWFSFYYLMVGAAAMALFYTVGAFWSETGSKYKQENPNLPNRSALSQTRHALTYSVTWTSAMFLFLYGGIEVGIGGWIVVFMTYVRNGSAFAPGMTETGFSLGITLGRLVPYFILSAFAVSLIGFFTGTIFPGVVVVTTRLLPKNVHVAAISFTTALSMGGGSVFPFMIGAISQAKGVNILQPIILAMLSAALLIWLGLLRFSK